MAKPRRSVVGRGRSIRSVAGIRLAGLAAAVSTAMLASIGGQAEAQSWPIAGADRDATAGAGLTFGLNSRLERAERTHKTATDSTAAYLLQLAEQDFKAGRTDIARRLLEQLIARYPDTSSADTARRRLFALYAGDDRIAGKMAGKAAARPVFEAPMGLAGPNGVPSSEPGGHRALAGGTAEQSLVAGRGGWRTSVIDVAGLQEQFRNTIGDRVFFSAGSARLGSRARAVLAQQAMWMQRKRQTIATIEGHADDKAIGGDNTQLATARAQAVRERLVAEGVAPERLAIAVLGDSKRIAVCGGSDCAAQNRRVVVRVGLGAGKQLTGLAERDEDGSFQSVRPTVIEQSSGVRR